MALAKHVARKTAAEGSAAAKERKKMDEQLSAVVDALHKKAVALLDLEDAAREAAAAPAEGAGEKKAEGAAGEEKKEDAFEKAYAVRAAEKQERSECAGVRPRACLTSPRVAGPLPARRERRSCCSGLTSRTPST